MKVAERNKFADQEIGKNDDADIDEYACDQQGSKNFLRLFKQVNDAFGGRMLFCFKHIHIFIIQREYCHLCTGNSKAEQQ